MTTDSERQRVVEQITNLVHYMHHGEGWRITSIVASVRRMLRELAQAEDELYFKE